MDISFYSNSTSRYRPVIQLIHDIYTTHLYYEKEIGKLKSNVKATRKVLNETLNRNKKSVVYHPHLAEILEKFPVQRKWLISFTNILLTLAPIQLENSCIRKVAHFILCPKVVNSIFLDAANEQEIIEICSTCRSGTAVGHDNISMNLIKKSIDFK